MLVGLSSSPSQMPQPWLMTTTSPDMPHFLTGVVEANAAGRVGTGDSVAIGPPRTTDVPVALPFAPFMVVQ